MIRTLTIAAAAAAVGYAIGQRAAAESESRFSRPEVTGDDVGLRGENGFRGERLIEPPEFKPEYKNPYQDGDFDTGTEEVIGR